MEEHVVGLINVQVYFFIKRTEQSYPTKVKVKATRFKIICTEIAPSRSKTSK